MARVTIARDFHRYAEDGKREDFREGQIVEATADDAANWKAAGLLVEPEATAEEIASDK